MATINWRNIEAPDFRSAGALMGAATQGFGNATEGFSKALQGVQAQQKAVYDQRVADNTNTFLNNLYGNYRSPEALQAAMQSGEIAQQLAGFGREIDQKAVRGAADSRLHQQRQQIAEGRTFEAAAAKAKDAPLLAQVNLAAQSGNLDRAKTLAQDLSPYSQQDAYNSIFKTEGTLQDRMHAAVKSQNDTTRTGLAVDKGQRDAAMAPYEMQNLIQRTRTSAAAEKASNAAAANSRASTGLMGSQKQNQDMLARGFRAINSQIDAEKAAVSKALSTGKYDSMAGPAGEGGKRDLSKVPAASMDALRSAMAGEGLNLDSFTGQGDGAKATQLKQALYANGWTGDPEKLDAQIFAGIGEGRTVRQSETAAGKREASRLAQQLDEASRGVGGLISTKNVGTTLDSAVKGLSSDEANRAKIGFAEAFADKGGTIQGKNGEKLIPDAATLNQIAFEVKAGGGSFGWLGTDARANHYRDAAKDWIKNNGKKLSELKGVQTDTERKKSGN